MLYNDVYSENEQNIFENVSQVCQDCTKHGRFIDILTCKSPVCLSCQVFEVCYEYFAVKIHQRGDIMWKFRSKIV